MQFAVQNMNQTCSFVHKDLYRMTTDNSVLNLGSEIHDTGVLVHQTYSTGSILNKSTALSPEKFFHENGKYPPSSLNVKAPDPTKPVTSIVEVLTIGFVSSQFPKTSIDQSTQKINIHSAFNFSKQLRPDCKLEVRLNDGNLFTYWVDSKAVNLTTLQNHLCSLTKYKNGDKIKCNFYFVGGLQRTHVFSFKEFKSYA